MIVILISLLIRESINVNTCMLLKSGRVTGSLFQSIKQDVIKNIELAVF